MDNLSRDLTRSVIKKAVQRRIYFAPWQIFDSQLLDDYRMSDFFNLKARAAAATTNGTGSSKVATPSKNSQTLQPWVEK